jgi:hypothetical protein
MRIDRSLLLLLVGTLAVPFAVSAQQPSPSGPPPSAQQSLGPQWRRAEKDEVSRARTLIQFTLKGSFLKAPRNEAPNRPALLVSCVPDRHDESEGKFTDAQVLVGSPLRIDYVEPSELKTGTSYNQEISVQLRLDDTKARDKQWAAGADKSSASIPKDVVKEMLHAHTVVIIVNEKDAGQIEMHFDVPDPTQLERACSIGSR